MLLLVLLGSVANILFTLQLREQVRSFREVKQRSSELPCAAIPTRFILDDPVCAQKLLTAMNVTHFKILSNASQLPDLDPTIKDRLAKLEIPASGNRSRWLSDETVTE
jgi:hypothetical protein